MMCWDVERVVDCLQARSNPSRTRRDFKQVHENERAILDHTDQLHRERVRRWSCVQTDSAISVRTWL